MLELLLRDLTGIISNVLVQNDDFFKVIVENLPSLSSGKLYF